MRSQTAGSSYISTENGLAKGKGQTKEPKSDPKSFKVTGADGQTIEIPPGEYYFNTKARCRRLMLNSLSSGARQVYACLEISTMGFQQEQAVKMENNKQVPLRPNDVVKMTGHSLANVRSFVDELERVGLAKRVCDDEKGLRKGKVSYYAWAYPRPVEKTDFVVARYYKIPDWFPPDHPLLGYVKRLKCELSPDLGEARDYLLQQLDEAARIYEEAALVVERAIDGVRAQPKSAAHIRNERTERNIERTVEPPPPPPLVASVAVGGGGGLPLPQSIPLPEPEPAIAPQPEPIDITPIVAAFHGYGGITDAEARKAVRELNATPQEIAEKAQIELANVARDPKAMVPKLAVLKHRLPKFFLESPTNLEMWRRQRDAAARPPGETEEDRARRRYRECPAEREWLKQMNPGIDFEPPPKTKAELRRERELRWVETGSFD